MKAHRKLIGLEVQRNLTSATQHLCERPQRSESGRNDVQGCRDHAAFELEILKSEDHDVRWSYLADRSLANEAGTLRLQVGSNVVQVVVIADNWPVS